MKVIQLMIGLIGSDKNNFEYLAEAVEYENRYYYCVDDVTLEITQPEYDCIIINPYLYYFSTALKMHFLVEKRKRAMI